MARRQPTDSESFGELLRRHRDSAGLSQAALALRARVSAGLIALLELNQRRPRRDKVLAIANALDLHVSDRKHLLLKAGHAPNDAPMSSLQGTVVPWALRELMTDQRLTPKQKRVAEALLVVFARWLRDELPRGTVNFRLLENRKRKRPIR